MAFSRTGWRLCLYAILAFLVGASPVAAQGPSTGAELDLIGSPDLSSPRATLTSLRTRVAEAYDVLESAYKEYRADPGFFASPAVSEKIHRADLLLKRAMATLDLSQVPAVIRDQTGIETVFLLKEILDRLPPIKVEDAPDAATVKADDLTGWYLPNTNLEIVRIEEGPKAGKFVFSADSVAAASEFYDRISGYLGRPDSLTDLYRFYTLTPGDLLPPKWYFWIEALPLWAQDAIFLGHALWQWVGLLLTLLILFGGWWAVVRASGGSGGSADLGGRFLRRLVPPVLLIGASLLAKWIIVYQINVSGLVLLAASTFLEGIAYLAAAWAGYVFCAGIGEGIAASPRIARHSIDASLIKVAGRVAGIAAAIASILIGATDVGLPLYGVIAGLGAGGLALGLAARPTLENLIGGLTLYADRPVRVGDICKFGEEMGTVEEIGLRSTRIRALDRTLITIPNAEFSNMVLINYTRRDQTLLDITIGLRYETTAPQIHAILDAIRAMLVANPDVSHDDMRVRLQELGPYALGIGVRVYIRTTHWSAFLEAQEGILFGIMKIIEDAGAEIAFMPRMTYPAAERPVLAPVPSAAAAE